MNNTSHWMDDVVRYRKLYHKNQYIDADRMQTDFFEFFSKDQCFVVIGYYI